MLAALFLGAAAPGLASAADKFPARPVEIIVPYPAGGSADFVSRTVAEYMARTWGSPVIVQNKPGAAGQIGFSAIAKSKADGYTIGLVPATFLHLPLINDSLPFNVNKDFDYIAPAVEMPFVMTVSAKVPVRSMAELTAYARKNPNALSYASPGVGTSAHILGMMLTRDTGMQASHVPFQGESQMLPMLISGEVPLSFAVLVSQMPFIKSGQLVPLLITSPARSPSIPDVPTAAELGLPNLEYATWFGFMAPKGIPAEAMRALNEAIAAATRDPQVKAKLQQQGMSVKTQSPEEFRQFVMDYQEKVRKIVQENAGATPSK